MPDVYFTEDGDIKPSSNGDIAITNDERRNLAQQVYLRVMTELGDFPIYPQLGAALDRLVGMPQNADTGRLGVSLIMDALTRDGRFQGSEIYVKPVPTGPQTIRFDIYASKSTKSPLILSVEQDLGV